MANTSPDGLPFPDDYSDPADSPAALEALANATQLALTNRTNLINSMAKVYVQSTAPTGAKVGDIWVTP
jgi:hypothetical protein